MVDIRPAAQRAAEGELGFGLIVERNVLEWRFDLTGTTRCPRSPGYDQPVVVVCSEGYASSLAADSLRQLGFAGAADLAGGYQAWRRWRAGARATPPDARPRQPPAGNPRPAARPVHPRVAMERA